MSDISESNSVNSRCRNICLRNSHQDSWLSESVFDIMHGGLDLKYSPALQHSRFGNLIFSATIEVQKLELREPVLINIKWLGHSIKLKSNFDKRKETSLLVRIWQCRKPHGGWDKTWVEWSYDWCVFTWEYL